MKNTVKANIILGMIAFFSTYPMELMINNTPDHEYIIEIKDLLQVDISVDSPSSYIKYKETGLPIPDDDQLLTDEGFLLSLATCQALEETGVQASESNTEKKSSKGLEAIARAVNKGASLTSNCIFLPPRFSFLDFDTAEDKQNLFSTIVIRFYPLNENTTQTLFEAMLYWPKTVFNPVLKTVDKTVKKRKKYIDCGFKEDVANTLEIELSKRVINLIFSHLDDEKNMKIIGQAKQKFQEE